MPEPINEVTQDVIDQVVATRSEVQSTVSRSSPASLLGELQGQRSLLTGRADWTRRHLAGDQLGSLTESRAHDRKILAGRSNGYGKRLIG
jgi:hypothetical protein